MELTQEDIGWVTKSAQRYCTARNINDEDAEDIIQNALLALVRCAERYKEDLGPFRRYASSRVWGAMRDTIRETRGRPGSARGEAIHLDVSTTPNIEGRTNAGWRATPPRPGRVRGRKRSNVR